jgi:serine/threonine protein kinase
MQIKLIDFGISCKLGKPGLNTEPMGTLLYISPESLDEKL